jgi:aspartate-semialdehyde dehydrogenase
VRHPLLRIAVVGATGAVGSEVLELLESRRFPLQELVPIATDRSIGQRVELLGQDVPVQTGSSLRGLDLAFLCTPRSESLAWVRAALEAEVACIDLSAATAATPEVPLLAADLPFDPSALRAPVLASPSGPALAWALVLAPIRARAGLRRVVGTAIEPVSGAGRGGIEALESETRALFSQQELPEPEVFARAVAFDCLPATGPPGGEGESELERELALQLRRLVGEDLPLAVTVLRNCTFAGAGASLAVETERTLEPAECADLLAKAPGVVVFDEEGMGPSTRDTVGEDAVLVGRIRRDPSAPSGLLLWLAADPIRLAARNGLKLAEARLDQR